MQIYNNQQKNGNSSGNSTPSCSYCGDVEHRATDCPHVANDWAMFQKFLIPCSDPNNWTNNPKSKGNGQSTWKSQANIAHWFRHPTGWGKWYAQCEKAHNKQVIAKAKAQAKTKGKIKTQAKCGFCGSHDHNRRNCSSMETFIAKSIQANREWRQQFYDKFVGELGISEGALLSLSERQGWGRNVTTVKKTAIVTKINWDQLSMCADTNYKPTGRWGSTLDRTLHQNIVIECIVDGRQTTVTLNDELIKSIGINGIVSLNQGWSNYDTISVISPSDKPMASEWIDQAHADAMKFVCKKRSYDQLKDKGFVGLVDKWYAISVKK